MIEIRLSFPTQEVICQENKWLQVLCKGWVFSKTKHLDWVNSMTALNS